MIALARPGNAGPSAPMLHAAAPHSVSEPDPGGGRRRRYTFICADLPGFTALAEAEGDEAAAALAEASAARLVRRLVREHRAEAVRTIGDAVIVRTEEARPAVELGLAIVAELGRHPESSAARVGMHTGPAENRGGEWLGATVDVAARACAAASGGEVLLTEATREAAGELDGVELERRGELRVMRAAEPVALFRAVPLGGARGRLVIDPVCRMVVGPGRAAGELAFEGVRYRFCSLACAAAFAAAPDRYAAPPATEA